MKKTHATLCLLILFSGCKKAIQNIQEDRIIDIMVDGQWVVTNFTINSTNTTGSFAGYSFQYHRNMTVDAIKSGSVEKTGNWDGDIDTKTTWADFPGADAPLTELNGSWHIDNNTTTYVLLSQNGGTGPKTMRLDKL